MVCLYLQRDPGWAGLVVALEQPQHTHDKWQMGQVSLAAFTLRVLLGWAPILPGK